jgi:hypothetical protein
MLRFMYGHAYDEEGTMGGLVKKNKSRKDLLSAHMKIYAIAQKYFVTKLIKEAEVHLATNFGRCTIDEALDAVPSYYAASGAGTKAGRAIARKIISEADVNPRIGTVVVEYPVLAADIVLETLSLQRFPPAPTMICNECGEKQTVHMREVHVYEKYCSGCGADSPGWTLDE